MTKSLDCYPKWFIREHDDWGNIELLLAEVCTALERKYHEYEPLDERKLVRLGWQAQQLRRRVARRRRGFRMPGDKDAEKQQAAYRERFPERKTTDPTTGG